MRLYPFIPIVLAATSLAGCASTGERGLTIDYDPPEQAVIDTASEQPSARPIEAIEPLLLPGQLQPAPAPRMAAPDVPPIEGAMAAQERARFEPERDGFVNAIHVYPYLPGALYRLYTSPGQVSAIALEPGESLVSAAAGDTLRWVLGDTVSGAGSVRRVHVLVKPVLDDIATNLVIATDRRVYHLELEATPDTYMASVSWTYPRGSLPTTVSREASGSGGLDPAALNFRYRIEGDDPPWAPLQAFDDGHKVYIRFPARLDQGEAPPLFVLGSDGAPQLVNYRMRGHIYMVDRLFAVAELRLGEEPQQVVRIVRTDAR